MPVQNTEFSYHDDEFYEIGQGGTVHERKFIIHNGVFFTQHNDGGLSLDTDQDLTKEDALTRLRNRRAELESELVALDSFLVAVQDVQQFEVRAEEDEDQDGDLDDLDDDEEDEDED